jgi:hypothetical protein
VRPSPRRNAAAAVASGGGVVAAAAVAAVGRCRCNRRTSAAVPRCHSDGPATPQACLTQPTCCSSTAPATQAVRYARRMLSLLMSLPVSRGDDAAGCTALCRLLACLERVDGQRGCRAAVLVVLATVPATAPCRCRGVVSRAAPLAGHAVSQGAAGLASDTAAGSTDTWWRLR